MTITDHTTNNRVTNPLADPATSRLANPLTNPLTGTVQIFGAVLIPTATSGRVAPHAPSPGRAEAAEFIDESAWCELERVMQARAASMASHPTARPVGLRLAS